jgi:hypothetical protein
MNFKKEEERQGGKNKREAKKIREEKCKKKIFPCKDRKVDQQREKRNKIRE